MKTETELTLTRIYKIILFRKINDISIGNLAYEAIEEMEKDQNIELSESMINNFIDMANDSICITWNNRSL